MYRGHKLLSILGLGTKIRKYLPTPPRLFLYSKIMLAASPDSQKSNADYSFVLLVTPPGFEPGFQA